MAHKLWTNWRVWIWVLVLVFSLFAIVKIDSNGIGHNLKLGSEFSGGTLFQLQLGEPASTSQLEQIRQVVEKRLNPTGIKDVTVSSTGNSIVLAQVAETDPDEVAKLQELLLKQGRFESFLNGDLIFDGGQIVQVVENAQQGYGAHPTGVGDTYQWTLPFLLNDKAARDFTEAAFHQCVQSGFVNNQADYDCAFTHFFIDRPTTAIVVYPSEIRFSDNAKLPNSTLIQAPVDVTISEILENANLHLIETDTNGLSAADLAMLTTPPENVKTVIVPSSIDASVLAAIEATTTLEVVKVNEDPANPWIVVVSGLRDVIALSPGITGNDPFIADVKDAKPQQFLVIQGTAPNAAVAKERLDSLKILLKSGALPIPIISINKQTVSAELGERFLSNVWLMGILSFIIVEIIIFIRYRKWRLVGPLSVFGISEVIMILGFAAIAKWNLDLASMAGILAAVGTGVDSEVIMTDEVLHKEEEDEARDDKGLAARAKRAFFIVAASASTAIAIMLPLVILGSGIGKLSGFALTTIAGVLFGVLVSRPAFQEIIKVILVPQQRKEDREEAAAAQN